MKVEIVCRKLIKPSTPTPIHLRFLKASFLDHLSPPFVVPLIYYYPWDYSSYVNDHHTYGGDVVKQRCRDLQDSLADVLTLFYPLAGRLTEDGSAIECNDHGAEYYEARVISTRLDEFLERERSKPGMLSLLVPPRGLPRAAIQMNIFECGGIAITICVCHKFGDGFTGTSFINALAIATRAGVSHVAPPSYELPSILPQPSNLNLLLNPPTPLQNNQQQQQACSTRIFVWDGKALSALKVAAAREDAERRLPSRVEVVSAIIWRALIGAAEAKHGRRRTSLLIHSINLRGKTKVSLPVESMGNFYTRAVARYMPETGTCGRLPNVRELTGLVGNTLKNTIKDFAKVASLDVVSSMVFNSFAMVREEQQKEDTDIFTITSLCKFGMYEVDFGWGEPIWVSRGSMNNPFVVLMDTKCGDGVEAWVTLSVADMAHFQQDPLIFSVASSSST